MLSNSPTIRSFYISLGPFFPGDVAGSFAHMVFLCNRNLFANFAETCLSQFFWVASLAIPINHYKSLQNNLVSQLRSQSQGSLAGAGCIISCWEGTAHIDETNEPNWAETELVHATITSFGSTHLTFFSNP